MLRLKQLLELVQQGRQRYVALGDGGTFPLEFLARGPLHAPPDALRLLVAHLALAGRSHQPRRVRAAGFELINVDCTILAQAPKMAPHIPAMAERV